MSSRRRLVVPRLAMLLVALAASPLFVVQAAPIYTSTILIYNTTPTEVPMGIVEVGVTGSGLQGLESNLLRANLKDESNSATIWEARDDESKWRALVPTTTTTKLTLALDGSTAVDDAGAWAYVTTPVVATNQRPGSNSFSLKARAYVGPMPKPQPTTLANVDSIEQYPSSNRMAEVDGTICMAYIDGDSALVRCSVDLGGNWGPATGTTFSSGVIPKQVSLIGSNGYLHMAVYTTEEGASTYVQQWWHVRGVLSDGDVSWGSATSIDSVSQASSGGSLLTHGVSIILTGTNRNQPSILYAYTDTTNTYIKRMYSTGADTWSSPGTTTALSVATSRKVYMVAQVSRDATGTTVVAIDGPRDTGGTIKGAQAGTSFSFRNSLPNASGTYGANPHFACVERPTNAAHTRVFCVIKESDGDLSMVRRIHDSSGTFPGRWYAYATIKSAVSGDVHPSLTFVDHFPHPNGDNGAFIVTWTESDGSIHQAWEMFNASASYPKSGSHVLVASGADVEGVTSPPRISNSARFAFGANSLAGEVQGYSMPPVRGALLSYGQNYSLYLEQDGQITANVGKHGAGATIISHKPDPGIYDLEAKLTWGVDWKLLLDGTSVASATYTDTTYINDTHGVFIVSHGWMADSVVLEINGVEKARWFDVFSEENGVYTTNDLINDAVGTVEQFFGPSPALRVTTGPLRPASKSAAQGATSAATLDVFDDVPGAPGGDVYAESTQCMALFQPICEAAVASGVPLDFLSPTATIIMSLGLAFAATSLKANAFAAASGGLGGLFLGSYLFTLPIWIPLIGILPWLFLAVTLWGRQPGTN